MTVNIKVYSSKHPHKFKGWKFDGLCVLFINVGMDICTSHKILHSTISGAPWSFDSWEKLLPKKISSLLKLLEQEAEGMAPWINYLQLWGPSLYPQNPQKKKMLSGYGHSHVILPADGRFLLQLRKLSTNKIQNDRGISLTSISCLLTHAHVHIHMCSHTHENTQPQPTKTHKHMPKKNPVKYS